jgi:uncharacterized membrane protein
MLKWVKSWNDEQMRIVMGSLLRMGVVTSAVIVFLGGILFFIQHPAESFDYNIFRGEPARLKQIHTIIKETMELKSRAVIQSGILLLIATPLARVLFSLVGFLLEKDWIYVGITFIVLTILVLSLFFL